ncbi:MULTISPECIES: photosynthesis system II assembly factor Ycf48 [Spirulina sp. CCY15215]|uniref:photosynthesis system II assembly factor Ycf48 n=1 Tax=Spirulina sp. CCY15215 TaxID=2767591 RepID=UPI0019528272|nr:photosynthesis system II assembly factor Ycf48 [Spirulina major]
MDPFVRALKQFLILLTIVFFCVGCSHLESLSSNPWQRIELPTEASALDIAFIEDSQHGWLVGSRATLFETNDGGRTWDQRQFDLGEEKVTFTSVSFYGQEGWIVGKPSILLHTQDGGQSWDRIALSSKLPGSPYYIEALGDNIAEMATDLGAIYKTEDGAKHWHALVKEAVGVVRNMYRSSDGTYIAVSSRGNFYSTWEPGQAAWVPHNRNSSRRLQNMGFSPDGRTWLIARGGQLQFSAPPEEPIAEESTIEEAWDDIIYPEPGTSWGLLDLEYRTPQEIWVTGGSGNLLVSFDGGETWQKDRGVEGTPSNFYNIIFTNSQRGFILGDRGIILRYEPAPENA